MAIDLELDKRLEQEFYWLEQRFEKKYDVLCKDNELCFEHEVILEENRKYRLRAYLNNKYPHQVPDLVVCDSPEPMPINEPEWRGKHSTHTWRPLHGFLHICHWHRAGWSEKYWIFHVFEKGEIWLKEYEKYLQGKELPLDLEDMVLTEEETQKENERRLAIFKQEVRRWRMQAIIQQILSPNIFAWLPIPAGEISKYQSLEPFLQWTSPSISMTFILATPDSIIIMSAEDDLLRLKFQWQWAVNKCRQANPECSKVDVSLEQTNDERIYVMMTPNTRTKHVLARSSKENDKNKI